MKWADLCIMQASLMGWACQVGGLGTKPQFNLSSKSQTSVPGVLSHRQKVKFVLVLCKYIDSWRFQWPELQKHKPRSWSPLAGGQGVSWWSFTGTGREATKMGCKREILIRS